jgi:hypothetical protein
MWITRIGGLAVAGGLVLLLGLPAAVSAGTDTEQTLPPCDLGTATVQAGTPLQLSGKSTTNDAVGVMARRTDGQSREGTVLTTTSGSWRAILLFDASDGGSWTVEIGVDGALCSSALAVTLPAGVVAPPVQAPDTTPRSSGIDASAIKDAAVEVVTGLILLSWAFLLLIGIGRLFGVRLVLGRVMRGILRGAVFTAVLGACLFAWAVAYFMDGMAHFDSGIPAEQQVVLNVIGVGALVVGSLLGTLAALRVRGAGRAGEEAS